MDELTTIAFSHYCDRARWALERSGIPYVERKYMPFFHFAPVWNIGRRHGFGSADAMSTRLSAPVLVTADGDAYHDSSDIVKYAARRCSSSGRQIEIDSPDIDQLTKRFLDRLGPHSRRLAYHHGFASPRVMRTIGRENVGFVQARSFSLVLPVAELVLRRVLRINDRTAARSLAICREEVAFVSDWIGDGRYLVEDRFSDADLTFATMAAPLLVPSRAEGYGAYLPALEDLPPPYARLVREFRSTPAGKLALRLYATERTV